MPGPRPGIKLKLHATIIPITTIRIFISQLILSGMEIMDIILMDIILTIITIITMVINNATHLGIQHLLDTAS